MSRGAPRNYTVLIALVIVVASVAVYWRTLSQPFLNYDDPDYVTENRHVQVGLTGTTIAWAPTATDAANWHPVTWISHALDCELYSLEPAGHHATSVILHAFNSVLVFLFFLSATGKRAPSAFLAGAFALHPLNVESVAWVAERKNVLSTLFFLLALLAYVRYVRRPETRRYGMVAALFGLGLAAKPMVITFPFVLLLVDYWPLRRLAEVDSKVCESSDAPVWPWTKLIIEKIPLFLMSAASATITLVAQHAGRAVEPLRQLSFGVRVENTIYSYAVYVFRVFWPVNLAPFYPHPRDTLQAGQIVLSAIFLMIVSALIWRERVRRPYLLVGWLWFLGTLVPVIGLIQVGGQGMADRYAYIPMLGILLLVTWAVADLGERWPQGLNVLRGAGAAALLALAVLTVQQLRFWDNSYDLWTHALAVTKDNFIAYDGIAQVLLSQGNPAAVHYYEAAAKIAPWDPASHAALAGNFQDQGRLGDAVREYEISLRGGPRPDVSAYVDINLGLIYRQLGNEAKAQELSARAVQTDPLTVRKMITQLKDRLRVAPAPQGFLRLGLLLEAAKEVDGARAAYAQALQLNPNLQDAQAGLRRLNAAQPKTGG
jgi:tetratricopeptide (TPR) repeat protein